MDNFAVWAIVAVFVIPMAALGVSDYQKYSCKKEYAHSTKTVEEINKICAD